MGTNIFKWAYDTNYELVVTLIPPGIYWFMDYEENDEADAAGNSEAADDMTPLTFVPAGASMRNRAEVLLETLDEKDR